jgi:hypothetical protein
MKNSGILRIGFKLLVNDKGKFSALLIAAISGYIGVRKVLKIEPFDIFRG